MKTKKTNKANLENKRTIFFQVGTILTLFAILVAFEWNSSVKIEKLPDHRIDWGEVEQLPPVTMPKAEIKEVKPPSFEFTIADDDDFIDEMDINIFDSEADQETVIKIVDIERPDEVVDDEPVLFAQFMPTFQGKDVSSFRNYIAENIDFPEKAKASGISGTVYATFVIDKDGSVTDVQILRGVHSDVDNAVIKVIKNSPKWEPGMNNGKYVKVRFNIPVAFRLL